MIYGIGTDICDLRRIAATFERQGERFARKVLCDAEIPRSGKTRSARWPKRGLSYLATRFSAKEAFSKAIGLGMRMPMTWRSCEIANLRSGKPVIVLHGELKDWFEAKGLTAHVTVTDETDYAASFVVVDTKTASTTHDDDTASTPLILDVAGTELNDADRRRLATRWSAA
jgi:holo-[acyl-carrier protein] synthase